MSEQQSKPIHTRFFFGADGTDVADRGKRLTFAEVTGKVTETPFSPFTEEARAEAHS